jgi:integrase
MNDTIIVRGRTFQLHRDPKSGNWRVRKRTKEINLDKTTGTSDLAEARKWARTIAEEHLGNAFRLAQGAHTLEEVAQAYLSFPKAVRPYVAEANVQQLRSIVRKVYDKELNDLTARSVTYRIWEDYAAFRHGGKMDLSTPRRENVGITSAIRAAASLFAKALDCRYEAAGIRLDFANLRRIPSLPVLKVRKCPVSEDTLAAMKAAWKNLKEADILLYRTIGLALFAGLRSSEIQAARRSWVVTDGTNVRVIVKDRPEEGFFSKGGTKEDAWLAGIVLDDEFAEHLLDLDGKLVDIGDASADWFFGHKANAWVRQFIPKELDGKGLHRLRGLYADAVKARFESQLLASRAGVDAARIALGHGSSAVTLQHYLTS